jgi:hypothetical protein
LQERLRAAEEYSKQVVFERGIGEARIKELEERLAKIDQALTDVGHPPESRFIEHTDPERGLVKDVLTLDMAVFFAVRAEQDWHAETRGRQIAADTDLAAERAAREEAEQALRTIQQWDCLNPPRADLLADLPWLRRVVDAALEQAGREGE